MSFTFCPHHVVFVSLSKAGTEISQCCSFGLWLLPVLTHVLQAVQLGVRIKAGQQSNQMQTGYEGKSSLLNNCL